MEQINVLIQKHIDDTVHQHLTTFIEYIAETYHMSPSVLLRDFETCVKKGRKRDPSQAGVDQCLGVTASKKRCRFKASCNGYCSKHQAQYRPPRPERPPPQPECPDTLQHTHTIPPLFRPDCPACKRDRNRPKENLLIDI